MTKRFNFPPGFFDTPFVDTTTGLILPEKQLDLQTFLIGDNLPDGNTRQQTKASNLLASDIPTNSDFEEFNDTGVVAYAGPATTKRQEVHRSIGTITGLPLRHFGAVSHNN
jgi:hypothetical protein